MRVKLTYLEIETINLCNRECPWCLFGQRPDFRESDLIYLDIFYMEKIFYELKQNQFKGVISFHSMNEPFLDKRITDGSIFRLCKNILVDSDVILKTTTNGDLLGNEVENMFNSGMDHLYVSCYSREVLNKSINMQKLYKNISVMDFTGNRRNKLNFNRAGSIKSDYLGENRKSCMLPLYSTVIGFDGELRLCCNDATGQISFGNIKNEKLYSILNSERMKKLRNKICLNRAAVFPCNICNFDDKDDVNLNPVDFTLE